MRFFKSFSDVFQSTPSVWKATNNSVESIRAIGISIHAFRVEGDPLSQQLSNFQHNFNPRLPCGRRLIHHFVSYLFAMISIHAFRVEGDLYLLFDKIEQLKFQSTPSVWKATKRLTQAVPQVYISIHAFRVEGDSFSDVNFPAISIISIHAFRVEGDRSLCL